MSNIVEEKSKTKNLLGSFKSIISILLFVSDGSGLKIRDMQPKWKPAGAELESNKDYERLVDLPVRAAVKHLNRLEIMTDYSSANNLDDLAGAVIRTRSYELSEINLKIATRLGFYNPETGMPMIYLSTPMSLDDYASDVSKRMLDIAKQFKKQTKPSK